MLRSISLRAYRFPTSLTNANALAVTKSGQIRQIKILRNALVGAQVHRLKVKMDGNPTEAAVLEYLKALALLDPKAVSIFIERGWENGKLPFNETFLKEYFKSVGSLNKFDSINISGFLTLLAKNSDGTVGKFSSTDLAALVNSSTATHFTAGRSPSEPLYVIKQGESGAKGIWSFLKFSIGVFAFITFVGAFLDDKSTGGAAAGISSRLGMGSVVHRAENSDKSFDDVVGIDEAKGDLQEIVMYLRDPKRFTRLGGKLPKGVLLTGPPGTGKTLLARAIAGEAKVPFFHASGSEFEEMFVGVGAKRVRELFDVAKNKSPCIIFIDEIDAIGGSRNLKDQSAMKMTLNQLLVEMDGFQQNAGVIVIAATNFPDSLDAALIRPGRFDKHVDVPMPDIGGRQAILELYGKKVPLDKDVDMEQLARGTPGFSGAELFNLVNQAALKASLDNLKSVSMGALEYAKDKIMMGAERRSAVISPETMKMTAFHEAGHALVALKTAGADPIHKATIMPRGRSLGMVMQLPDGDQTSMSRKQMLARLDICMGGRVAEEIVFGHDNVTSGASSDIMQATRLAKAMVTKYGLSDKVGVVFIDEKVKQSGETQKDIDEEVKVLLSSSYQRAKTLLELHRKELDIIAKGLLDHESLAGGEIVDLLNGKDVTSAKRSQRPSRATQALPTARNAITTTTAASNSSSSISASYAAMKAQDALAAAASAKTAATLPTAPPSSSTNASANSFFSALTGSSTAPSSSSIKTAAASAAVTDVSGNNSNKGSSSTNIATSNKESPLSPPPTPNSSKTDNNTNSKNSNNTNTPPPAAAGTVKIAASTNSASSNNNNKRD